MDIDAIKHVLPRWKNDIEQCLGFLLSDTEIENAYTQYAAYCTENNFENLILSELSSFTKDCLLDFVCLDLVGVKMAQHGSTVTEKRIFNRKIKEIISLRALI